MQRKASRLEFFLLIEAVCFSSWWRLEPVDDWLRRTWAFEEEFLVTNMAIGGGSVSSFL